VKFKPEERFIKVFGWWRPSTPGLTLPQAGHRLPLTTEVGGTVIIGDRVWRGDDPLTLPTNRGPSVVSASEETAAKILGAIDHKEGEHGGKSR
jgi:hypothetical protein